MSPEKNTYPKVYGNVLSFCFLKQSEDFRNKILSIFISISFIQKCFLGFFFLLLLIFISICIFSLEILVKRKRNLKFYGQIIKSEIEKEKFELFIDQLEIYDISDLKGQFREIYVFVIRNSIKASSDANYCTSLIYVIFQMKVNEKFDFVRLYRSTED